MQKISRTLALPGDMGRNRWVTGLLILLVVAIGLLFVNFAYMSSRAGDDHEYIRDTSELRMLSQQLVASVRPAREGQPDALRQTRQALQQRWELLARGDAASRIAALPESLAEQTRQVHQAWAPLRQSVDALLGQQDALQQLQALRTDLATAAPALQGDLERLVEQLVSRSAPASQVALGQRQLLLLERIRHALDLLAEGGGEAGHVLDSLGRDSTLFGQVLGGLQQGSATPAIAPLPDREQRSRLEQISKAFQPLASRLESLTGQADGLRQMAEAAGQIPARAHVLQECLGGLLQALQQRVADQRIYTLASYVLVGLILLAVVLIGLLMVRDARRRLADSAAQNERNQAAILRLLDEIGSLADGDLTVTASVTEAFTGAIADSINYSIDQLRELVQTINQTAQQIGQAVAQGQGTAARLVDDSARQNGEISAASAAIHDMSHSIDQVSAHAAESATVAERSLGLARRGNELVHDTISGMDSIRTRIQDTAKRIKRLGESSQEIGDIVGLIDDIADQTNILALNAAIQAAMAGEAGRGFAVVADEVQRLAERSSAATRQIEALVRTIQSDTGEAVVSMEQTTTEVVQGARLAQDAGVALEDIETVSGSLAGLIRNISGAARQQTASASQVAATMTVIQDITSRTSAGVSETAGNIGHLAELASDMRRSVAGFTLPARPAP